jgi:inositol oxygenase
MVTTGFVHDLGKCLCLYGEPQWGVVGDTFPTGCAYSDAVVFPEYFRANPTPKIRSTRQNSASTKKTAASTK